MKRPRPAPNSEPLSNPERVGAVASLLLEGDGKDFPSDAARYDYRFDFGEGGHSLAHGGATFADALQWIWRTGGFAGEDKKVDTEAIQKAMGLPWGFHVVV